LWELTDENKASLLQGLHEGVMTVGFTKVNGERRLMVCTLDDAKIPGSYLPLHPEYKRSPEVCSVWDLEANGWRSFRWDSVFSAF
jgi:hypothetical protein